MATDELWCQSDHRYLRVHFLPSQVKRAGSFTRINRKRRGKLLAVVSGGVRNKAVFVNFTVVNGKRRSTRVAMDGEEEEQEKLCYRQRAEKAAGGEVVNMQWSPTMDVIALAFSDNSVRQ